MYYLESISEFVRHDVVQDRIDARRHVVEDSGDVSQEQVY